MLIRHEEGERFKKYKKDDICSAAKKQPVLFFPGCQTWRDKIQANVEQIKAKLQSNGTERRQKLRERKRDREREKDLAETQRDKEEKENVTQIEGKREQVIQT